MAPLELPLVQLVSKRGLCSSETHESSPCPLSGCRGVRAQGAHDTVPSVLGLEYPCPSRRGSPPQGPVSSRLPECNFTSQPLPLVLPLIEILQAGHRFLASELVLAQELYCSCGFHQALGSSSGLAAVLCVLVPVRPELCSGPSRPVTVLCTDASIHGTALTCLFHRVGLLLSLSVLGAGPGFKSCHRTGLSQELLLCAMCPAEGNIHCC